VTVDNLMPTGSTGSVGICVWKDTRRAIRGHRGLTYRCDVSNNPFQETRSSTPEELVLSGVIGAAAPDEVYAHFTDAGLLCAWWPDRAETDPRVGGAITASWIGPAWTMRGEYTVLVPGERVGFTWSWDHEPDTPARTVLVELVAGGGGALITLRHGSYGRDDVAERRGHLEGWQHFLPKLANLFGS
jgi:uncharacterized protein YndB with AHSA1/START domain